MEFPITRTRNGNLVTIYTENAGGDRPVHGAYLAKDGDRNRWVPCSWTKEGNYKEGRETGLDLSEWPIKQQECQNAKTQNPNTNLI